MLEKDSEVFVDTGSRIIPINLFHKGNLSGVYETMDFLTGKKSSPIWNYSAGSRSIFMLPKITDKLGAKRLHMTRNIPATIQVNHLTDHFELFKSIAQNKSFSQEWHSTALFFGEKWITNKHTSKEWMKFKNYLLCKTWEQATYAIDKLKFNLNWEKLAEAISLRRLQPKPYLIDQVKHVLNIVAGNFPAFKPIDTSQESAPTRGLQQAIIDCYTFKYLPTLMHACALGDTITKAKHVYYSLSLPTVLEGSPLKKNSSTIISDMREFKFLIETLKNYRQNTANNEATQVIKDFQIDYFHFEKDMCDEIRSSTDIAIEDGAFLEDKKTFQTRDFCATSPFFSGCIRISK